MNEIDNCIHWSKYKSYQLSQTLPIFSWITLNNVSVYNDNTNLANILFSQQRATCEAN